MKIDTSMVSPDGNEEDGLNEAVNSHEGMENSAVQSHEFGDNCLNGIKWPPEHYKKNSRAVLTFNGFGRLKPTLVTHGGRTSKLPARFIEPDSVGEFNSRRRALVERRKKGLSSSKVGKLRKDLCKNGRSKSLTETSVEVTEHLKTNQVTGASKERKTSVIEKNLRLNLSSCLADGCNNCANTRRSTTSGFLKKPFENSQKDLSSSGETPKRKRGRPPKNKGGICKVNEQDTRNRVSPHGNFAMNATKAALASPSPSKFGVKRKRAGDVCNSRRSCSTSSSDEGSVGFPTPKKRGRPPRSTPSSASSSKEEEIFKTPNGVRKPWVRPFCKTVENNAVLVSASKKLDGFLASPDQFMAEVKKRKLTKVNGALAGGKVDIPRRRGRPPKNSSSVSKETKTKNDVFHFTDDEDMSDAMLNSKLKKLKSPGKLGKRPMGVVKFKKTGLAQQLKKKAVQKAKHTLKSKLKSPKKERKVGKSSASSSQAMPEQQSGSKIEKVLGMKRDPVGHYEYLVQLKDGTSCWVPSHQLGDFELDFGRFLQHSCQDLPVVHRLPFRAYWHDNLLDHQGNHSLIESTLEESGEHSQEERTSQETAQTCMERFQRCKEVSVKSHENYVHIIVKRSSSKRSKVNLRIVDAVIAAMEDASEDNSDYVRISGLGEELFCGLDLNTMTTVAPEDEIRKYRRDIDRVRYLVQMIQTFPKPVMASLDKPGQGLGARLFSLCDLVCDEDSLSDHGSLEKMLRKGRVPYCFPRLMGHASVSERLLMGQELLGPEMSLQEKASAVFKDSSFTKELKGTLKAMSALPQDIKVLDMGSQVTCEKSDETLSELEKELQEQQRIAEECLKDIQSFWQEITTPAVSSRSVSVA